jgi:hypothetical protein
VAEKNIIVTVNDERLPEIDKVADDLASRGMKVERVMPGTGVISGSYPQESLAELGGVDGVLSVEEELSAELPPDWDPQ